MTGSRGKWRGTGEVISEDVLGDETQWRQVLALMEIPRDVVLPTQWYPAVVLGVAEQQLTVGIEDGPADGVIPRSDIKWMQGDFAGNFKRGDVILVVAGEEGQWSARQVPEVQGGFVAMDVNSGRVLAMQGRVLVSGHRVQPRHASATPAGLQLQTLRLCRSTGQRLQPGHHRCRRTDRGEYASGPVAPQELVQQILRARHLCALALNSRGT